MPKLGIAAGDAGDDAEVEAEHRVRVAARETQHAAAFQATRNNLLERCQSAVQLADHFEGVGQRARHRHAEGERRRRVLRLFRVAEQRPARRCRPCAPTGPSWRREMTRRSPSCRGRLPSRCPRLAVSCRSGHRAPGVFLSRRRSESSSRPRDPRSRRFGLRRRTAPSANSGAARQRSVTFRRCSTPPSTWTSACGLTPTLTPNVAMCVMSPFTPFAVIAPGRCRTRRRPREESRFDPDRFGIFRLKRPLLRISRCGQRETLPRQRASSVCSSDSPSAPAVEQYRHRAVVHELHLHVRLKLPCLDR